MKRLFLVTIALTLLCLGGAAQAIPALVITENSAVAAVANWDDPCAPYEGYLATTPELDPLGGTFTAELTWDGGGFGRGGGLWPWTLEGAGYELFPNWAQFAVEVASDNPPANPPLPYVTPGDHILITLTGPGLSWGTVDRGLGALKLTDYNENVLGTLYVVPEPSSIIALLGGLGSLLAFRRRRA